MCMLAPHNGRFHLGIPDPLHLEALFTYSRDLARRILGSEQTAAQSVEWKVSESERTRAFMRRVTPVLRKREKINT